MARLAAAHLLTPASLLALAMVVICSCGTSKLAAQDPAPLVLEKIIPLPDTKGRIDHLAYDPVGRRLFVAELGNGTVDAIDLASGKPTIRIAGLHHPQGLAWLNGPAELNGPGELNGQGQLNSPGELAIADEDGMVRFYRGDKLQPSAKLQPTAALNLGDDADDLRVDPRNGFLIVGYGDGALATIDPATHAVVRQIPLPAHPEGFQLDGGTVWVNLPKNGSIIRGDLDSSKVTARWSTGLHLLNFPMAFDAKSQALAIAYRLPARLALVDPVTGAERQMLDTCGDSDDIFFDETGTQLFVICGSGEIDIYRHDPSGYALAANIPTRSGARTGLFVPQESRLYIAAREDGSSEAAILVFRPAP